MDELRFEMDELRFEDDEAYWDAVVEEYMRLVETDINDNKVSENAKE
jgi:hypothetical protein